VGGGGGGGGWVGGGGWGGGGVGRGGCVPSIALEGGKGRVEGRTPGESLSSRIVSLGKKNVLDRERDGENS